MWSALCVGFLPIVAVSLAGAATLEQPREVTVEEGKAVTLQCKMTGDSMRYYSVSWYRQGPTGSEEWIYREDGTYGEGFKNRFQIKDEKFRNSFPLQIRAAEPGDAATYYCRAELRMTATGPGTILTVEPKVIVEKTTASQDVATTVETTPLPTTFHTENTNTQNTTERICTDKSDSRMVTILPDPEEQRVNTLSMAVLGLRVLLAKGIAFNTLMSIKLFLF